MSNMATSRGGRKVILSDEGKRGSATKKSSVFDRLGAQPQETAKSSSHFRYPEDFTSTAQPDQRNLSVQTQRRTMKIQSRVGERRDSAKTDQTAAKIIEEPQRDFGTVKFIIEKQISKDKLVKAGVKRPRSSQSFKELSDISDDESEDLVKTAVAVKPVASNPRDFRDLSPVPDDGENRKGSRKGQSGRLKHRDSSEPESKQPNLMAVAEQKGVSDKQVSREKAIKGDTTDNSGKRKLRLVRHAHCGVQELQSETEESPPKKKPNLMATSDYKKEYEQDLSNPGGSGGRASGRTNKKHKERMIDDEQRLVKEPSNDIKKDHQQKNKSKKDIPESEKSKGKETKEKTEKTEKISKQEKTAREERNLVTGDTDWAIKAEKERGLKGVKTKKDRDREEKEQDKLGRNDKEDKRDRDESSRAAKTNSNRSTKTERLESTAAKSKDDKQEKGTKAEQLKSTTSKLRDDKHGKDKVEKVIGEKVDKAGREEKSSKDDRRDKDKRDKDRSAREGRSDKEVKDRDWEDRDRGDKERRDKDKEGRDKEGRDKDRGKKESREGRVDKNRGEREDKESSQGNKESRDKDRVVADRKDDMADQVRGGKEIRVKGKLDRDGKDKDRGDKEQREKERSDRTGRERDRGFKDRREKNAQEVSKSAKDGKEKDRRDKEGREDKGNKDAKDKTMGNSEGKERASADKENKETDRGQSDVRDKDRGDKERRERDKLERDIRGSTKVDKDKRDDDKGDKGKEGHSKGKQKDRDSSSRERTKLSPFKESSKDVSPWDQGKQEYTYLAGSDFEKKSASPDSSRIRRSKRPRSSPSVNPKSSKRRRQESPLQGDKEELHTKPDAKQTKSDKTSVIVKTSATAAELGNNQERNDTKKSGLGEREVAGTATGEVARKETSHVSSREKIDVDIIDEVTDSTVYHAAYSKDSVAGAADLSDMPDKNTGCTSHGKKSQEKAKEKDKDKEKKERTKERSRDKDKGHADRDLPERGREHKKTSGSRYEKNEDSRHKERDGKREGHTKVRAVGDRERSSYRSRRDKSKDQSNHRERERERRDGDSEKDRKDSAVSSECTKQKDNRDSRLGVGSAPQTDDDLDTLSDTGSDALLDEETKAKEKQCQLLESMSAAQQLLSGIDWASLQSGKREAVVGDFTHRMSPAAVFSRVGVSAALAGEELYQRIQRVCLGQSGDDSSSSLEDQTQKCELGDYGLNGQLLTARRDMALRAKLRHLSSQGPHTSQPPPVDRELYQMALSIYRQQESDGTNETTKSAYKLVHSKVGSLLLKA